MTKPLTFRPPDEMSLKELRDWLAWAEEEIEEYSGL